MKNFKEFISEDVEQSMRFELDQDNPEEDFNGDFNEDF